MREDIDRAIDDVARRLTAGEPDGAFRARVMARIESGERARRWPGAWIMSPLPIAALIVIALAAAWSYRSPQRLALQPPEGVALQQETIARGEAPVQVVQPVPPGRSPATFALRAPVPTERLALPSPARPPRARAMQPSEVGALAPPLLNVPSIALAPIDRGDSIQLPQLEPIAPIALVPLPVEPENREP